MELADILLTKEEIPIKVNEQDFLLSTAFAVPIHLKLLSDDVKLNPALAISVFPKAAEDWYADLQATAKGLPKGEAKDYIMRLFLNKPLSVRDNYGSYVIDPPGFFESNVVNLENGFASSLYIDRNAGGGLYIDRTQHVYVCPPVVKFSEEKFKEFSCDKQIDSDGASVYIYHQHNVDYYPGALFLRNWAILYLNEAMKQVL